MGAMQAQDYGQALWAIGARTDSATLADVEDAIRAKQIVRTWPMRGTIHFVPARDAAWSKFGQDPEWKTLSGDPQYRDNVSAISDIILQATPYSQL